MYVDVVRGGLDVLYLVLYIVSISRGTVKSHGVSVISNECQPLTIYGICLIAGSKWNFFNTAMEHSSMPSYSAE